MSTDDTSQMARNRALLKYGGCSGMASDQKSIYVIQTTANVHFLNLYDVSLWSMTVTLTHGQHFQILLFTTDRIPAGGVLLQFSCFDSLFRSFCGLIKYCREILGAIETDQKKIWRLFSCFIFREIIKPTEKKDSKSISYLVA